MQNFKVDTWVCLGGMSNGVCVGEVRDCRDLWTGNFREVWIVGM